MSASDLQTHGEDPRLRWGMHRHSRKMKAEVKIHVLAEAPVSVARASNTGTRVLASRPPFLSSHRNSQRRSRRRLSMYKHDIPRPRPRQHLSHGTNKQLCAAARPPDTRSSLGDSTAGAQMQAAVTVSLNIEPSAMRKYPFPKQNRADPLASMPRDKHAMA